MSPSVVCVAPEVSVEALVALLIEHGVSGVPVVDGDGRPVGVVSKTDVLHELRGRVAPDAEPMRVRTPDGYEYELGPGFHPDGIGGKTVGDLMTGIAFTLDEETSVIQAAALMAFEGVHRVPVVARDGAVVGIVSSLDVLRWLAREDGYLLDER